MDYDKDPIIVTTPYTFKQMRTFQRFHHRKLRYILFVIVAAILAYTIYIVPPGTGILAFLAFLYDDASMLIGIIIPVVFIVFLGVSSFGLLYTRKKHDARTIYQKAGQTCVFRSSDYEVQMNHPDAKDKIVFNYDLIYCAYETKDMFYIYTDKNMAALVDKQGFKNYSPDDLRELLRKNVPAGLCKLK